MREIIALKRIGRNTNIVLLKIKMKSDEVYKHRIFIKLMFANNEGLDNIKKVKTFRNNKNYVEIESTFFEYCIDCCVPKDESNSLLLEFIETRKKDIEKQKPSPWSEDIEQFHKS